MLFNLVNSIKVIKKTIIWIDFYNTLTINKRDILPRLVIVKSASTINAV